MKELSPTNEKRYKAIVKHLNSGSSVGEACEAAQIPSSTWYGIRAKLAKIDPKRLRDDLGDKARLKTKNRSQPRKSAPEMIEIPAAPGASKLIAFVGTPSDVAAALASMS